MAHFEDFKPKLNPCEIHQEGHLIVIEETLTGRHYMLPAEAGPLLSEFDGVQSIREIATSLHRSGKSFHFKTLFSTILQLHKAGFLSNREGPLVPSEKKRAAWRSFYEWARTLDLKRDLIRQIQPGLKSVPLFKLLATLWIALGLGSLATGRFDQIGNTFLLIDDSYFKGLIFYVLAVSALLSIKSLVQFMLLELASGRVYGVGLRAARFSIYLSVTDSSIYLVPGRVVPALFHLASLSSLFAITWLLSLSFGQSLWFGDLRTIVLILTLLEINPYFSSDFQKFLYLLQRDETRGHLVPYLKNRSLLSFLSVNEKISGEGALIAYSALALAWSSGSLYLFSIILIENFPNLDLALGVGSLLERVSVWMILAGLILYWLYFILDLVSTLAQNLYYPMTSHVSAWKRNVRMATESLNDPAAAREILCRNPLFADMDEATLKTLLERGKVRSYPEGTELIIQGVQNGELFAVIKGTVCVRRCEPSGAMHDIATLGPSSVFGETSVLEEKEATANVVALEKTLCLALNREALRGLDVGQMMEKILVGHFIGCSPTFKNLPKEVISLVMRRGKTRHVPAGQVIFEEGSIGNSVYFLVHGRVEVVHGTRKIKDLPQGEFFGEIALIARTPRNATIRTTEECVLLQLDSDAFWEILAENPEFSLFLESVAEMRERDSALLRASA